MLDDVTKTGVGSNYETKKSEEDERHVLRQHYGLSSTVARVPERAYLNDRGERQPQAWEAQCAEQWYEEVQFRNHHG